MLQLPSLSRSILPLAHTSPHFLFYPLLSSPAFSLRCAYNRINNTYACENEDLLETTLREEWEFDGWVVTDWRASGSTIGSANNGLEMEMPVADYFSEDRMRSAIDDGAVGLDRIDLMVKRILTPMFRLGLFEQDGVGSIDADVTSDAHRELARRIVADTHVLLKNDNSVLPLDKTALGKLAVVGDVAHLTPIFGGGGSGEIVPMVEITPFEGIEAKVAGLLELVYIPTANSSEYANEIESADAVIVVVGAASGEFEDRQSLPCQRPMIIS